MSKNVGFSDATYEALDAMATAAGTSKQKLVEAWIEIHSKPEIHSETGIEIHSKTELHSVVTTEGGDDSSPLNWWEDERFHWWKENDSLLREAMRKEAEMFSLPDGTRVVYPSGKVWNVKRSGKLVD